MDSSEVGSFGTLRLMKRLEPDKVVASYPIDEEEITFGRDPTCSIRLYYETVSGLHCKLIFRERKAFLVVLGVNGLVIDGCPVYPANGPSAQPVTVPLPNNSAIEIHKKRFQFCYPPKELRSTLISTPTRPQESTPDRRRRRRTLRMSMIQSAQVFTPRPSHDPRENLRILKTPLKSPFIPSDYNRRLSSPLKRGAYIAEEDEEEEEEQDIVLVESNHPRVVEEDRDLVILEHVVAPEPEPEPEPPQQVVYPIPQADQPPAHMQQTPARRRGRPSLHRAVLIRSAHRTALQKEMEMEEEREVEEVEEIFEQVEQQDNEEDGEEDPEAQDEDEGRDEQRQQTPGTASGWRKSLNFVKGWAFGGPHDDPTTQHTDAEEQEQDTLEAEFAEGEEPEEMPAAESDEDAIEYDEDEDAMDIEEEGEPEPIMAPPAPQAPFSIPNRPLGKFMTPQVPRQADFGGPKNKSRSHIRYSVGGFTPGGIYGAAATGMPDPAGSGYPSGPRRVRVVEPWKVSEITVPLNDSHEQEQEEEMETETEVVASMSTPQRGMPMSPSKRERLTEDERKAIIQRRRSALTEPDFFGGQTPGRRVSLFPPLSPMKSPSKPLSTVDESFHASHTSMSQDATSKPDAEEVEDTSILLARMKNMVEDAKLRQSMGARPSLSTNMPTPRKSSGFSLLAPESGSTPVKKVFTDVEGEQEDEDEDDEDVSDKENDAATGGPMEDRNGLEREQAMEEDTQMHEPEGHSAAASGSRFAPHAQTPRLDDLKHMFGPPRVNTTTPSFQGIRQMFNQPARPVALETPRLDGVRPLFTRAERGAINPGGTQDLYHKATATPTFDGIGKMFDTPAGYRTTDVLQTEERADDEEPPAETTKSGRARKPNSQSKTTAARRTSPRVASGPEPSTSQGDQPVEEPVPSAARVTRKTRGKASESDTEHQDAESQPKTTRRTRKTTPSPAPEDPGTSTRSLRKTRAKTPTPTPEDPPATRASSSRRRARTPIAEVEEEEDPIDSLGDRRGVSPEVPAPDESAPTKGDSKVRRSARGKFTMQVKEEDEESPVVPTKAPAEAGKTQRSAVPRAVRGRRPAGAAAAATLPRTSSIPRGTARGAKAASLKRPATTGSTRLAAESAVAPVVGNKENTPEPDEDEPAPPAASGKATAARSTSRLATKAAPRTVGRTRAASVDQPEKPADTGKTRVSRTKAVKK